MPTAGQIQGLRSQSTSATTLRIGEGYARDTTDTAWISVPSGQTRDVSLSGSGAGGIDTGTVQADTSYALWIVLSPANQVAGVLSLSFTAPSVPGGFKYRRIGAVVTDGSSQLAAFVQSGTNNDRTVEYTGTPTVLRLVNGASAPSWTDLELAPGYPTSATTASIYVSPVGAATVIRPGPGGPETTVTGPTVLGLTPPLGSTRGSFKTEAGGTTTIWLRGFSESL